MAGVCECVMVGVSVNVSVGVETGFLRRGPLLGVDMTSRVTRRKKFTLTVERLVSGVLGCGTGGGG